MNCNGIKVILAPVGFAVLLKKDQLIHDINARHAINFIVFNVSSLLLMVQNVEMGISIDLLLIKFIKDDIYQIFW